MSQPIRDQNMGKPNSQVVIQQIILPEKPDFMDKKRVAAELGVSEDTIEKWVRERKLIQDKHFFSANKVLRFYYPAIKLLLVPDSEAV